MSLSKDHFAELQTQETQSSFHILEVQNELRLSSKEIAKSLGIDHGNFLETLRKYSINLQEFGGLPFETETLETAGGKQLSTYILLNEDQSILAGTFSRNSKKVVKFKTELVKAFSLMRKKLNEVPTITHPQPTDIVDQSILLANQLLELAHKLRAEREAKRLVQVQLDHKQEIILDLTEDIPVKQMRATINEVIRWNGSEGYGSRWYRLYKQFKYHYGVDISIRAKNRKMNKLDYAEQNNLLTDLYKLALELFEKDNPNINQSQLQLA